MRCQHYWTACQMVATTDLLLTMPEPFAAAANAAMDNRLLPFPVEVGSQDVYLYWHSSSEEDPANHWLREQIRKCLSSDVPASHPS
jgi:DNA-binding transcriptional LysR family regulator